MSLTISPAVPIESQNGVASEQASAPVGSEMIRIERSKYIPLYFAPSVFSALVSYAVGGLPLLNDFAFFGALIAAVAIVIAEFRAFSFRWGLGTMLGAAGVIVWLGYDYVTHWSVFFGDQRTLGLEVVSEKVLGRAVAAHMLFLPFFFLGMRIRLGGWVERRIAGLPGPRTPQMWLALCLVAIGIGFAPYFIFTRGNPIENIWRDIWAGRAAGGAQWVTGRTGNANYSWGAYIAQIQQVGIYGSIIAGYFAIMVARTALGRVLGIILWVPAALQGFGSGTRGMFLLTALPLVGFLFVRLQANAAAKGRRVSLAGLGWLAAALMGVLVVVQIQIAYRDIGFQKVEFKNVSLSKIEGNMMFSESLHGFAMVPDYREPFYSSFPGQSIIWPAWDTVYWFVITPFPRAVWNNKPIDPVGIWYNKLVGRTADGVEGTTISNGLVGYWYFRFGWPGVIEGGLILGFMFGVIERLLREHSHKPLAVVAALGLGTCCFRTFRGLAWLDFHPTMVGLAGLAMLTMVVRLVVNDNPQPALEDQRG